MASTQCALLGALWRASVRFLPICVLTSLVAGGAAWADTPAHTSESNTDLTQYERGDLEIADRAADASEAALAWARASSAVGAVGTLLLVLTVIYGARATKAAADNAKAAFALLEHERDTAHRSLRPYLFFETMGFDRFMAKSMAERVEKYKFNFRWNNVGATPAEDCESCINIAYFKPTIPPDYNFPDLFTPQYIGIVPHGKSASNTLTLEMDPLMKAIAEGAHIHIWGWVEYESRPGAPRHRTEWHAELQASGDPRSTATTFHFESMRAFNGADRYCHRQPARNATTGRPRFFDHRTTKRLQPLVPVVTRIEKGDQPVPPGDRTGGA